MSSTSEVGLNMPKLKPVLFESHSKLEPKRSEENVDREKIRTKNDGSDPAIPTPGANWVERSEVDSPWRDPEFDLSSTKNAGTKIGKLWPDAKACFQIKWLVSGFIPSKISGKV